MVLAIARGAPKACAGYCTAVFKKSSPCGVPQIWKLSTGFCIMGHPEYSDSVNAMNGCLFYCLEIVSWFCSIVVFLALAPWIGLLLLVWWFIAWILGLIFPGKEFFPIKKIYHSVSGWCEKHAGQSLDNIALASLMVVLGVALMNGIERFFSRKD